MSAAMQKVDARGLQSYPWRVSYKTSSPLPDGRPVNILRDFYIPALSLATRYDRVAGYFRSSSLAAASQGFSTFVGREGKMRLIVGADLEPSDVKAILDGDAKRLAAELNEELRQPSEWPEDIRNGVTLLGWMVAQSYLEVRVAFRTHGETGEPLPFDDKSDGYVHEKWFLMQDEFGNRLYGTGSLNESRTALQINAENVDVHCDWWGDRERLRIDTAEVEFEALWEGHSPYVPVLPLPEAVRRRLIDIGKSVDKPMEIDGSHAYELETLPTPIELLRFRMIADAPKMPGGRFVGMETAPVKPWPHQSIVVRRLVESWPYSYLLCDEVGLGKTIEAGLAFRSLYLSGLVKRILVAAPAGLTHQWQRQMATKVLLPFGRVVTRPQPGHEYVFPANELVPSRSIYEPDLMIMSTGLLMRKDWAQDLLLNQRFDIALVDEAHNARRRNPTRGSDSHPDYNYLYRHIREYLRPRARSLWLATATPMQIHPVEVYDLLALTNRVGAFQFDPSLTLQYYEMLGRVVGGQNLLSSEWEFLRQCILAVKREDPLLWRYIEGNVIDGRIRSTMKQWLEYRRVPRGRDKELIRRVIFSSAPLSRVMLRHTRGLLEIYREEGHLKENLPRREILPMPRIAMNNLERRVYDQLEEYYEGLKRRLVQNEDGQTRQMVNFLLSFFRLRFASSLYAIHSTLERRLEKVRTTLRYQSLDLETEGNLDEFVFDAENEGDDVAAASLLKNRSIETLEWEARHLEKMIEEMAGITVPSSKMLELLRQLDQRKDSRSRIQQTVIFTRFYDTLTDIVRRLRRAHSHMLIGTYSGQGAEYYDPARHQMIQVDREEVKERFLRGEIDVLVCTDAAAEGLNLQTADLLINFDMGWNPMKIEQRIGRIDRIGQKHDTVHVLNLCYLDSAEETVYGRLLARLAEANLVVGSQGFSLLPLGPEDFRQLADGEVDPQELEMRAKAQMERQQQQVRSMEMEPKDLYDIYMRLARDQDSPAPIDLPAIWEALTGSLYLQSMGCEVRREGGEPFMVVSGIEGIPSVAMTVSRELYDRGLPYGRRVHFASYGDPYFDRLLNHLEDHELPSCICRIEVPIQDMQDAVMVGYAVACQNESGVGQVRLLTCWDDLQDLKIDTRLDLSEADIEPLRERLTELAISEFGPYLAADRIERGNIKAARLQEILNLSIMQELLGFSPLANEGSWGAACQKLLGMFDEREYIRVNDLPAEPFRRDKESLLFDCGVPTIGDKAYMSVPKVLGYASVDAAYRLADRSRLAKSEDASIMITRLEREIRDKLKHSY